MWSAHFVPRPKDWPEYVDIVGSIFCDSPDPIAPFEDCMPPSIPSAQQSAQQSAHSATKPAPSLSPLLTPVVSSASASTSSLLSTVPLLSTSTLHTPAPAPISTGDPYTPTPELLSFLTGNSRMNTPRTAAFTAEEKEIRDEDNWSPDLPIFVGFGSMVIENPKHLLQLLLQGQ
jgi:hypothetical protein